MSSPWYSKSMKTITATELNSILASHKLWIESSCKQGVCADLSDANLEGANLRGADLEGANLRGANLTDASLYCANLVGASLTDADLNGASLHSANLWGANLYCADLTGANLYGADLTCADLTGANLTGTILEKKAEKKENVCVNSSFGEELQMLLDKHGVKLAAAIQLELK